MEKQEQTSLITILSSDHGRWRREQRDIDKRDLQKAFKYGTRSKAWGKRWRIEYDGIIFITDESMRREVTAYPSPLALYPIEDIDKENHRKAKQIIEVKPTNTASHTVLVMDVSGSMLTHDIHLHRDRQTAAYSTTALEFIAEQLFNQTANNRDVVSLIEFKRNAQVIFDREPQSWVLYNRLLSRRDNSSFVNREYWKIHDTPSRCDSNYMPALKIAEELLSIGNHDDCALSLFFFSDGAPTDANHLGLTPAAAQRLLCDKTKEISERFNSQLTITMVGFGNKFADFDCLEKMVNTAKNVLGSTKANFVYCDKLTSMLGEAVTSMVTSLTDTRLELANSARHSLTKRGIESEIDSKSHNEWKYYKIMNHYIYNPKTRNFKQYPWLPPGALREQNENTAMERNKSPPQFLAIKTRSCGEGVERVAFRCQLSDNFNTSGHIFAPMVAKETNLVERIQENVEFHKIFMESQSIASHLADEFNKRLRALQVFDEKKTPRISFLPCSVLVLYDPKWPEKNGRRGVLVEKMLDTDRLEWRKWNNNAGAVDGKLIFKPMDVDKELKNLFQKGAQDNENLDVIVEGDSEEESDSGEEEEGTESGSDNDENDSHSNAVAPSDYLQAFSHFTYRFTNRKFLVCDLQGVYDEDSIPPKFELSDPAIHYRSTRGRRMVYGRTDKGKKGIQLFFNTHRCSKICQQMQVSKINKNWFNQWKERHGSRE